MIARLAATPKVAAGIGERNGEGSGPRKSRAEEAEGVEEAGAGRPVVVCKDADVDGAQQIRQEMSACPVPTGSRLWARR